ncbi:MAG: hypothetical protein PHO15_06330 [Eubacteriales bacterium]|nr:hypothetical protein [Eubacteriales bacterium]
MRVRKLKEKDIHAAAALMSRTGLQTGGDVLARRLQHFRYRRNHAVVVLEQRGRLVSLMHIGIEPSLTKDRAACVCSLFTDKENNDAAAIEKYLLSFGKDWARQHGCDMANGTDINEL